MYFNKFNKDKIYTRNKIPLKSKKVYKYKVDCFYYLTIINKYCFLLFS